VVGIEEGPDASVDKKYDKREIIGSKILESAWE
jgi:hypothetical protein